jgi:hypothetical protein
MLLSVDQSIQLVIKGDIRRGEPNFWPPRSSDLIPMGHFCEDTSRTLCMVKRFWISGTYGVGSQQPSQL